MMHFDLLVYKSILLYIFRDEPALKKNIDDYFEEKEDIKNFRIEANKYRKHQKKFFGKKFLNEEYKIAVVK